MLFCRFIQTAEMLKPTLSSVEEEIVDHFPHLVLLHNRAQMENFCPSGYMTMQKVGYKWRNRSLKICKNLLYCRYTGRYLIKQSYIWRLD